MKSMQKSDKLDKKPISKKASLKQLDKLMADVNTRYKTNVVMPLSDLPNVDRVSSGVFQLDSILGGGWPMGRFSLIYGQEGSGKTGLCLKAVAEAQKHCPDCLTFKGVAEKCPYCKSDRPWTSLFIDTEGTLDRSWASRIGVNIDQMFVVVPDYTEQAIDIMDYYLQSPHCPEYVILDSIASMSPMAEQEGSAEDNQMGLQARLCNKAVRKWNASFLKKRQNGDKMPSVFLINQIRSTMAMYGPKETTPGGKQQKYAASIVVALKSNKVVSEKDNVSTWLEVQAKTVKNKTFPKDKLAEFNFCIKSAPEAGIRVGMTNERKDIFNLSVDAGIIEKQKDGYAFEGHVLKTQALLKQAMAQSDLYPVARKKLLDIIVANEEADFEVNQETGEVEDADEIQQEG